MDIKKIVARRLQEMQDEGDPPYMLLNYIYTSCHIGLIDENYRDELAREVLK